MQTLYRERNHDRFYGVLHSHYRSNIELAHDMDNETLNINRRTAAAEVLLDRWADGDDFGYWRQSIMKIVNKYSYSRLCDPHLAQYAEVLEQEIEQWENMPAIDWAAEAPTRWAGNSVWGG